MEIDYFFLKGEFMPDVSVLDDKAIAHSLEGFAFSKDALTFNASNFLGTFDDGDDDGDGAIGVYVYLVSVRGGVGRCIARSFDIAPCARNGWIGGAGGGSQFRCTGARCVGWGGVYEYTT